MPSDRPDPHTTGGEPAPEERRHGTPPLAREERSTRSLPAGLPAASKFVGRLAQLDLRSLGEAIAAWRAAVASTDAAWFDAEAAVAGAIAAANRHTEQRILVGYIGDLFVDSRWFSAEAPGTLIGAAEPAAQYVATLAMLALLVRDRLAPGEFELLYRPFARLIPPDTLARE
jgi:hypothetical protein